MNEDFGKVRQMFVQLGQGFGIVAGQQYLFPQVLGRMSSFDGLNIKVNFSLFFTNGSILGIGQRAGCAIAKTSDGVWVFAEMLFLTLGFADCRLERTKLVIDHLPYHFVVLHLGGWLCFSCCCLSRRSREDWAHSQYAMNPVCCVNWIYREEMWEKKQRWSDSLVGSSSAARNTAKFRTLNKIIMEFGILYRVSNLIPK